MPDFNYPILRYLEELGLNILGGNGHFKILKKEGTPGNSIVNFTSIPIIMLNEKGETISEFTSDCPVIQLAFEKSKYIISCWNYTPGPGPGDFEIALDTETEALEFIKSYYFGNNSYFNAAKEYYEKGIQNK